MTADADARRLVIVDADMLAGWRRVTSSLDQLHAAVDDLRHQAPDAVVAVISDPALKWALPESDRLRMEEDIRTGALLLAPAGCDGGHLGFIARTVDKATTDGWRAVVVTDRAIPGARLARVRRDGTRWVFDLEGVELAADRAAAVGNRGPRRRRPSPPPEA
ncbi:MAG: hypothetical protein MUF83_00520 [Acidimicrobiales bacterium]|jgi:hypothetical protein|nr:hypothetical protein [Acidimicrobiales bacterium]